MELRKVIEEIPGFRFLLDRLEIQSALAKRVARTLPYLHSAEEIRRELDRVEELSRALLTPAAARTLAGIDRLLMQVKDIRGTAARLREGETLDDIELFELKSFAILSQGIRTELIALRLEVVTLPDLEAVITLLDPERMRVPHFYIYDAYSPELAALRAEIQRLKAANEGEAEVQALDRLLIDHAACEDRIREELSAGLHPHAEAVTEALTAVADLDLLLAKGRQAAVWGLCKPQITAEVTRYRGIFHPQVRAILTGERRRYQPVDIELGAAPCLITGANMAGKSVLLKTVALAQAMCQFGFYVPAEAAEIVPVEEILLCMGDEQSELSGLSSYASEMLRVDAIVTKVRTGIRALILIDELARTTNPTEGGAIVRATLDLLTEQQARALVTTHYSGIAARCRKLRVRGFMPDRVEGPLTIRNINDSIDYSLVEEDEQSVPQEALRIARILGVDEGLVARAEQLIAENKQ